MIQIKNGNVFVNADRLSVLWLENSCVNFELLVSPGDRRIFTITPENISSSFQVYREPVGVTFTDFFNLADMEILTNGQGSLIKLFFHDSFTSMDIEEVISEKVGSKFYELKEKYGTRFCNYIYYSLLRCLRENPKGIDIGIIIGRAIKAIYGEMSRDIYLLDGESINSEMYQTIINGKSLNYISDFLERNNLQKL